MRTDLVLGALRMALTRRQAGADVELIHHSDAGAQYTSYAFGQVLDDHQVLQSIVRDTGFLDPGGFAYSAGGEPPNLGGEDHYRHLIGDWYLWRESW